jgi:hypothetical protein
MSYATINACANDVAFQNRLTACCAQEGANPPATVMYEVLWPVSTASDIAGAYEFALNSNNPDPGGDETVITDHMILSAVQANWPTEGALDGH